MDCEVGKYADVAGQAACEDCPGNLFSDPGATACEKCLRNFFWFDDHNTCEACPEGVSCLEDGGSTQTQLYIEDGYWRSKTRSSFLHR